MPIFAASAAASEVPLEGFDEFEPPEELDELELPVELDELVLPEVVDELPEEAPPPPPQAVRPSDATRSKASPRPGKELEFIRPYSSRSIQGFAQSSTKACSSASKPALSSHCGMCPDCGSVWTAPRQSVGIVSAEM